MRIAGIIIIFTIFVVSMLLYCLLLPVEFEWKYLLYILGISAFFSSLIATGVKFIINRHLQWMQENIKKAMDYIRNPHFKYPDECVDSEFFDNILELFKRSHEDIKRDIAKRDEFIRWLTEEVNRCSFELNRKNKEVIEKEKNIALGHLVATLAHKLGTPLNSMAGHIQLVLANNKLDYDVKNRLEIVVQEIVRIEKIIRQALDVLTLDRHNSERINIKEFLSEIIDFLLPSLSKEVVSIELNIEPDLSYVYTDPDMLREVIINLISNAGEAIQGKGFIRVSAGRKNENTYFISVEDNGVGISSELKDKIFEPFYTTKHKGKASGLGLAICKEIARVMGGSIELESTVGKGSIFTFTFIDKREGNI
ncbi:MAG: sensor histidine kinase [Myxococcota bacterium]